MKKIRLLLTIIFMLAIPFFSTAHEDKLLHYRDFIGVFNGYGDQVFRDFSYTISTGIDSTLPDMFREQIGKLPGNHRVLGHGWTLNDAIPSQTLEYLSKTYPGQEKEIISIWRMFAKKISDKAVAITGLPKAQANAFASFLYDIHLLGDVEPGNKLYLLKSLLKDNIVVFYRAKRRKI